MEDSSSWEAFSAAVAASVHVPAEQISPRTRLDRDLGLDSLALTELVVLLIVEFDMQGLAAELEQRDWTTVTVGALYEEYRNGREAAAT